MRRKNVVWGPRDTAGIRLPWCPIDVYPSREVEKMGSSVPPKKVVVTGYLSSTIFFTSMIMGEKGNQTKLPVVFYTLNVENVKFTAKGRTAMNCLKFWVGCY